MRRVRLRGHTSILKRLLIHTGGFNLGLLMRQLTGVRTPRGLQGRLTAVLAGLLTLIRSLWKSKAARTTPFTRTPLDHEVRERKHRRQRNGFTPVCWSLEGPAGALCSGSS
jgi:hypothetical protein